MPIISSTWPIGCALAAITAALLDRESGLSLLASTIVWHFPSHVKGAHLDPYLSHFLWAPAFLGPFRLVAWLLSFDAAAAWHHAFSSHTPTEFALFIGACIGAVYTIMGFALLAADLLKHPQWLQEARTQPKADREWHASLPRLMLRAVVGNMYAGLFGTLLLSRYWPAVVQLPSGIVRHEMPSFRGFSTDVALLIVTYEVVFYYSHRMLHTKRLYARIHKIHHEWKSPTALAATYAHPIEYVISNVGPALVGAALFRPHYLSLLFFSVQGIGATLWAHSGYAFPEGASAHDRHHQYFEGNYGHVGVLDWVHGTAVGPGETWSHVQKRRAAREL